MRKRSWTKEDLIIAITQSKSVRQVLSRLHLVEAGGNYDQVKRYIKIYNIDTTHFTGQRWNRGMSGGYKPNIPISKILNNEVYSQSNTLKRRLFKENLKVPKCEGCGWSTKSEDGRIPVELDHVNGDRYDNRLENLRILCPNCHSLKKTHRGLNMKKRPGGGTGYTRRT